MSFCGGGVTKAEMFGGLVVRYVAGATSVSDETSELLDGIDLDLVYDITDDVTDFDFTNTVGDALRSITSGTLRRPVLKRAPSKRRSKS